MRNFFTRQLIVFALLTLIYKVGGFEYAVILALSTALTVLTLGVTLSVGKPSREEKLRKILKTAETFHESVKDGRLSELEREIDEKINRKV